jgi:hypothetical protein
MSISHRLAVWSERLNRRNKRSRAAQSLESVDYSASVQILFAQSLGYLETCRRVACQLVNNPSER